MTIYWVPCWRNSSYSFALIILKVFRCFLHGMKLCMWFGCNSFIIFSHFFCFVNIVFFRYEMLWKSIDSGYLVGASLFTVFLNCFKTLRNFADVFWMEWRCACGLGAIPLTVFLQLFWNFADVLCMEWRCACGFGIILWLFFLTFSALWT